MSINGSIIWTRCFSYGKKCPYGLLINFYLKQFRKSLLFSDNLYFVALKYLSFVISEGVFNGIS